MNKRNLIICLVVFFAILIPACSSKPDAAASDTPGAVPDVQDKETPAWLDIPLTDVQTGKTFTISDFAGKVVLVETMAMWCPNCVIQANEVRTLHKLLGNSEDLVSVSLDVDVNEDGPALKDYSEGYGFEWRYAVAPLEIARALGNLYSAQYLNPPLSPMLVVDRQGEVHELPYGQKSADDLLKLIQPFLDN